MDYHALYSPARMRPTPCTLETRPTLYAVTACRDGVQVPTFFLSADVQGIVGQAHAERIAREIVGPVSGLSVIRA